MPRKVPARAVPPRFKAGWLAGIDRRYAPARVASETLAELHSALGGDLTPQQRLLCERVVWAHARLQQMEQHFATTGQLDASQWSGLTNTLLGLLRTLGLRRVAKDVPSLRDYIAQQPKPEEPQP
ncbi:MAG: hypothetical protein JSR73_10685 [Proteobacteria bacterium]|nr:hypothetical protein [Pseudomonadota bacterium]